MGHNWLGWWDWDIWNNNLRYLDRWRWGKHWSFNNLNPWWRLDHDWVWWWRRRLDNNSWLLNNLDKLLRLLIDNLLLDLGNLYILDLRGLDNSFDNLGLSLDNLYVTDVGVGQHCWGLQDSWGLDNLCDGLSKAS
jgi:hypothetical protein